MTDSLSGRKPFRAALTGILLPGALALAPACRPAPSDWEAAHTEARTLFEQGRLSEAIESVRAGLAACDDPPGDAAQAACVKLRILEARVLIDRREPRLAIERTGFAPPAGLDDLDAHRLAVRATALAIAGRLDEAAREAATASERLGPGSDSEIRAYVINTHGYLALLGKRLEEAEARYLEAARLLGPSGSPFHRAAVYANLGYLAYFLKRYEESIDWYQKAAELADAHRFDGLNVFVQGNLGFSCQRIGDFERAAECLARAVELAGAPEMAPMRRRYLGGLGLIRKSQLDHERAIGYYRQALEEWKAESAADLRSRAIALNNLADSALAAGRLEMASQALEEARRIHASRQERDEPYFYTALHSAQLDHAEGKAGRAEAGYREVIRAAGQVESSHLLWEARLGMARCRSEVRDWAGATRWFEEALEIAEGDRQALRQTESALSFHPRMQALVEAYVDFLVERGQPRRALELSTHHRAETLVDALGERQGHRLARTAEELEALARKLDAVLLHYALGGRRSTLWIITGSGIRTADLPARDRFEQWTLAYRDLIEERMGDPLAAGDPAGRALYDALIRPAEASLSPDARVIVAPDGVLHSLNFETLPDGARPGAYLLERLRWAVAPSLSLLDPGAGSSHPPGRILIVGNPEPASRDYPALPFAAREVAGVRKLFADDRGVAVLEGARAVPASYRASDPGRFRFLHFAAHAETSHRGPLSSAIILSDAGQGFKLHARDIADVPLEAELVAVSACRSSGARVYAGEGLTGLSWAFLRAGACNVVGGLWNVGDRSTTTLMLTLYERLLEGADPATALRQAKLVLLRSRGAYRKPYYWAPFQIYTRGDPFRAAKPVLSASRRGSSIP